MPSPQSTRVCFTLNNPNASRAQAIAEFLDSDDVRYGIVGREVGASGTPHLQGFTITCVKHTHSWFRRHLPHCHIEFARGTSQQARAYCQKDGDYDEYGDFPSNGGTRNDIQEVLEWSDAFQAENGRAPVSPEVAKAFPIQHCKYPRLVRTLFLRADPPKLREGEPKEWQHDLAAELDDEADDRKIVFYVDPDGGNGKTWFQQWYYSENPDRVQILSVGKRDDIAHAIDESKSVFFFNVPRGGMQYFQYVIAESLKDRQVFSPKYNSRMKNLIFVPHVVIFCNEQPDYSKMSEDRFDVRNDYYE